MPDAAPSDELGGRHEEVRRAEAAMAVMRYSHQLTKLVERTVGTAANREVQILVRLFSHGPARPHDLVALTGLSRPNVARIVARLESLGLVSRTPGRHDRRTVLTSLTRAGRRRVGDLDEALRAFYAASAPTTAAVIELLGGAGVPANTGASGLDVAAQLAAAGGPIVEQTVTDVGPLSGTQRHLLLALSAWGAARPGRLAEEVRLSSGGMTNLLNQLEAEGYVKRRSGAVTGDRRAVIVRLTPRGAEIARRLAAIDHAHAARVAAALAATLPAPMGNLSVAVSEVGA